MLHILQQAAAFAMALGFGFLNIYSFVVEEDRTGYFSILSKEERFEDTEAFDEMLVDSLHSIIRYNVAKSQMEENGKFDGSKVIDAVAFANRRSGDTIESTIKYRLEDLLKWEQYGIVYELDDYTLEGFLEAFPVDPSSYNGYLTDSQKDAIRSRYVREENLPDGMIDMGKKAVDALNASGEITEEEAEEAKRAAKAAKEAAAQAVGEELNFEIPDGNVLVIDEEGNVSYYYTMEGTENAVTEEAGNDTSQTNTQSEASDYLNGYKGDARLESMLQNTGYSYMQKDNLIGGIYTSRQGQLSALATCLINNGEEISGVYIDSDTGEMHVVMLALCERYKTVDNETIFELAGSLAEYGQYRQALCQAIEDLSYNYREYLKLKDSFGYGNTNIRFYFRMSMLGEQVETTNLTQDVDIKDMDTYFKENCGKYIIYKPQNVTLDTNTRILTVEEMFDAFNMYEYAYPDTAKMWIGVDTSYPVADGFQNASETYRTFRMGRTPFMCITAVSAFVWIVLFLYLSVRAGRIQNADGKYEVRLTWFDQIPTEIYLLLSIVVALGLYLLGTGLMVGYDAPYVAQYREQVMLITTVVGGFVSICLCTLWYSFIRRCKKGHIFKGSLFYLFWRKCLRKIIIGVKNTVISLYDNAGSLMQALFLYGGIMVYNFLAGVLLTTGRYAISFMTGFFFFVMLPDALSVFFYYRNRKKKNRLIEGIHEISDGNLDYQIDTAKLHGENLEIAKAINSISDSINEAVAVSMKDEKLKADLITNVSHDIKTPLTSIINYVDLLKRENIETQPVKGYIEVLDQKSQRLKHLTEDLVEASKISSGNINLHMEKIDLTELLHQTIAEFSDKLEDSRLHLVDGFSGDAAYIEADGRRIYRVVENLFGNICKYAMPDTRVYVDKELTEDGKYVILCLKNISAQPMNIKAEELTERFIRGDVSRSTEGSGLGLSIAKNLTELQNGKFHIYLDGDLFKVTLQFPVYVEKEPASGEAGQTGTEEKPE